MLLLCRTYVKEDSVRRKITVNPKAKIAYMPKDLIEQGLSGELEAYANAVTLTIVKPDTPLKDIKRSLEIVLDDIRFRMSLDTNKE